MTELHTWPTPNGRKIAIMLEETGLPYSVHPINITKGEQHNPDFLKISPNNRIPGIIDTDEDVTLMESGAILMYLAEKTGKFLSTDPKIRLKTIEWLMWQMGGFGPMLGQVHHFVKYNKGKSEYGEERYLTECKRLYGVLDRRLAEVEYMAGDYSIADMATWPWAARFDWQTIDLNEFSNVKRWYKAIAERPAIVRAWNVPENEQVMPMP